MATRGWCTAASRVYACDTAKSPHREGEDVLADACCYTGPENRTEGRRAFSISPETMGNPAAGATASSRPFRRFLSWRWQAPHRSVLVGHVGAPMPSAARMRHGGFLSAVSSDASAMGASRGGAQALAASGSKSQPWRDVHQVAAVQAEVLQESSPIHGVPLFRASP
jgi:hypothetical protein